eukprot:scaffold114214_cov30-Tisochrysis_lutea.AAC.13
MSRRCLKPSPAAWSTGPTSSAQADGSQLGAPCRVPLGSMYRASQGQARPYTRHASRASEHLRRNKGPDSDWGREAPGRAQGGERWAVVAR